MPEDAIAPEKASSWLAALASLAVGAAFLALCLRKVFGAQYEEYCRNVRRWIPRLQPWNPN